MHLVIFGSGPMPCEPKYSIMAPGARTWQIAQTACHALAEAGVSYRLTVLGLESSAREDGHETERTFTVPGLENSGGACRYLPCTYEQFTAIPGSPRILDAFGQPQAVIGCASVQPCATAAEYASCAGLPLWIDLFGDPISEVQSKAELEPGSFEQNENLYLHVWRLLGRALLEGDRFSALSSRQRHGVVGQLGTMGRLNRRTRAENLVHTIPYALFPSDYPKLLSSSHSSSGLFTVMWCGSFNTWMDVHALVGGVIQALRSAPTLRLLIVGGRIPGYNEASYEQFAAGIRDAGLEALVDFREWCSLEETHRLYSRCNAGLSIDRYTYEAVLGSRTRIINFLAAGKPVISTVPTELAAELAQHEFVIPFRLNDPDDLARVLIETASRGSVEIEAVGQRGREYLKRRFDGASAGAPLADWLRAPSFASDKGEDRKHFADNPLIEFWRRPEAGV